MSRTRVDDASVHWIDRGRGSCVVLLHGLGGDVGFWAAEIEDLAAEFRVIAIDARGSGLSSSAQDGLTIADLADDVAAVMDDASVTDAAVIGFSLGGLVAQELALRHPKRVRSLVLASTYACMNQQARLFLDAVADVYGKGASARQMFELIAPWLFSTEFVEDPAHADFFDLPDGAAEDQTREDWLRLYAAQQAFDGRELLSAITAPTLVIHGALDHLVSSTDATLLVDRIPDSTLHTVSGAGHLLNVEAPAEFLDAVRSSAGSAR